MDKAQGMQAFWSSFGLPAYDQNTVPEDAEMPYITYELLTDSLGTAVPMLASLWYYTPSWREISQKAEEIAEYIATMSPPAFPIDGGRIYITKGTPFAQRMSDESPFIRRIVLSVMVEYFTEF